MHRVDLKPPVSILSVKIKHRNSLLFTSNKFDFKSRLGASEEALFLKAYLKLLTTVPIF